MAIPVLKVHRVNLVFHGGSFIIEAGYHACVEIDGMLRSFAAGESVVQDEHLYSIVEELVKATELSLNKIWGLSPSEAEEDPERSLSAPEQEEDL